MEQLTNRVTCDDCPIKGLGHFREMDPQELVYVSRLKTGEFDVDAGATILFEGVQSAHLFTVISGVAFRYKTLEDGRRQILNYIFPGDLLGLQASLMDEMQHSVEALTPVKLCVFERGCLPKVFADLPALAFDITWLSSREERILDENLLSIGRRTAEERAAHLLAYIYERARTTGITSNGRIEVPITQQHLADTLGLSVVHTNKTLRKLAERRLIKWRERNCEILDEKGLRRLAAWQGLSEKKRPFL